MATDLGIEWRRTEQGLVPYVGDEEVVWAPQAGAQQAFLACPLFEVLLEGNRGGGKTDALLMDFGQHVGQGYGQQWRGILFRQTFPQLQDVVAKTKQWFPRVWPLAEFNEAKYSWRWPAGETLRFSYMDREDDYWNYHGHAYPWIGWEELTTWADDRCYSIMKACCRSPRVGMPRKYRSNTNPYGPGQHWVKARFKLPVPHGKLIGPTIRDRPEAPPRVAIRSSLAENLVLLAAEPDYREKVAQAAGNPAQAAAWIEGDWDAVSGGMFDDLWGSRHHVVPDVAWGEVPKTWRVNRSYDHGQSRPFSVGWWAESNGEPLQRKNLPPLGVVRGDLVRVAEWYGWTGKPNEGIRAGSGEIAEGIVQREREWGIWGRVQAGPADSSIFDQYEPGKSVAGEMGRRGVRWTAADKRPGSRKQGWQMLREFLAGAIPGKEGIRERPGIFVCASCDHFLRTVPTLPRSKKDQDDVDTDAEDHVADEVRYRIREKLSVAGVSDF